MNAIVLCSCGARAEIFPDANKWFCENPEWKFVFEDRDYGALDRAEIETLSPNPGWHCGAPGHFNVGSVNVDGTGFYARDMSLYPAYTTPATEQFEKEFDPVYREE